MPAKKTAKRPAKPADRAVPAEPPAAKRKTARKASPKSGSPPDTEAIARAAYLIYRRRVEQGLPGDSESDWLEAERGLGPQA